MHWSLVFPQTPTIYDYPSNYNFITRRCEIGFYFGHRTATTTLTACLRPHVVNPVDFNLTCLGAGWTHGQTAMRCLCDKMRYLNHTGFMLILSFITFCYCKSLISNVNKRSPSNYQIKVHIRSYDTTSEVGNFGLFLKISQ